MKTKRLLKNVNKSKVKEAKWKVESAREIDKLRKVMDRKFARRSWWDKYGLWVHVFGAFSLICGLLLFIVWLASGV